MKIYVGNNKKSAKQITFEELLAKKLKNFKIERDSFSDNSARWIEIIQKTKEHQVAINLLFSPNYEDIIEIGVYLSKIITIVDEEHTIKLI